MSPDAPEAGISTTHATHAASPSVAAHVDNSANDIFKMAERESFNFGLMFAWMIALFAMLATLYLWWDNRVLNDSLEEKKLKKTSVLSQLETPSNKAVEKEANEFKQSVAALAKAKKSRYDMTVFMPAFYTKINNDVKLTSISMTAEGTISIAGSTGSYRQIADQAVALKSWNYLKDVDLTSSTLKMPDEKSSKVEALFSISAKIQSEEEVKAASAAAAGTASSATSASVPAASSTSTSSATSTTTTGGNR